MSKEYYANKHGVQLSDFIDTLDFKGYTISEAGCIFNALKYICRAGRKTGSSYYDDTVKAEDYLNKLVKQFWTTVPLEDARSILVGHITKFEDFTSEDNKKFRSMHGWD